MTQNRAGKRAVIAIGSLMYALFAAFGWQAEHLQRSELPRALLWTAVLFVPAAVILTLLLRASERRARDENGPEVRRFSAWRAFAGILICDVPMFLILFPGSFAYDVPFQLEQVFTGAYSSHHPLLHTLLLGGCAKLGRALGQINLGAALYTVLQMTGLSACFALTCASIARQANARAARRAALFFALYPLHMMFAVNATKDVLFSGLFALTLALTREAALRERMSRALAFGIAAAGAGMMLLRNNAVYAVAVWLILLLLGFRRRGLRLTATVALAAALACGINGLLAAVTGAQAGDPCEMLSWPIQQLARARVLDGDRMTDGERAAIDELMPGEAWRLYDPTISDPVKFEFDTKRLLDDPQKYAQVYLSVGAKCPAAYFDALLMHTYSFFYPYSEYGVSGYYLQMGISDSYYEWCDFERIHDQSLLPRVRESLAWRFGAKGAMQIPVIGWAFNMGLIVWVMLYFVLREAYLGAWRRFAAALLPVLLWGTYLLGPVMAGRYIYPFVCALPVLASGTKAVRT
ncbi:MAG: DUF6020 family protein [Clostridia bacterium]|nr:DUF6020 family protein [Clostridia bacterium]